MAEHNFSVENTLTLLLDDKKYHSLRDILSTMNPADIAAVFDELPESRLPLLFRLLPKELAAETFVEMDTDAQALLIRGFSDSELKEVVGAGIAEPGKQLLTVTELGYGKRTEMNEYLRLDETGERRPQQRGGKGLKNYNITAKTGRIAGIAIVSGEDDVMLIENGGVLIRMAASDINVYKRDTQGVILMRVEEGNRVISIERVDPEQEEE